MKKGTPGGLLIPGLLLLFLGLFATVMGFGFLNFFGTVAIAIVVFGGVALVSGGVLVMMFYRSAAEERRTAPRQTPPTPTPDAPAEEAALAQEDPFVTERKAVVIRKIKPWEYPPAPKYCPWCGTGLFADYMYCPKCGKEL